jgi:hypothetical protein
MAIVFEKTAYTNPKPVFWRGETMVLPGGFKLLQAFPVKFVIPKGTLCQVNYPDLTAAIIKVAKVIAGGTTTAPRVVKGTMFQVGDIIMKEGETTGKTVTAIDRKNSDYDVITFNSALTGLTVADILLEATDTTGAEQKYAPNAAVESTKEIDKDSDVTVSACDHVRILEGMVYPVPASFRSGLALKDNPTVTFIYQ